GQAPGHRPILDAPDHGQGRTRSTDCPDPPVGGLKTAFDTSHLDPVSGSWVVIGEPWGHDLLAFLGEGRPAVARAEQLITSVEREDDAPAPSGLPFTPMSLRAFALWESHMVDGARGMVAKFGSPAEKWASRAFERLTGAVLPALRPRPNYYRDPQFYMGNHRSLVANGEVLSWPPFADVLDFELELGVVIARPVQDCLPADGLAAIGGFVVVNDWSARDTQWDDTRRGTFGGVVKAKTFAGGMSAVVVTADEVLPRWDQLNGRVLVNGEVWAHGSTQNPRHGLGAAVAYAACGESLGAGDVLSTGTLPGCCGLEMRRFPGSGDEVRLEIDGIGSLTNRIGPRHSPVPTRADRRAPLPRPLLPRESQLK
uniref:fumarylacetoacetate hydrolase family protein n=1 Tax=Amycolatopsis sp. cmx-4-68 TaxID=2790938 RepID=UPI00397AF383